jgi:O-antigen/teichoic acid export membrane protein
MIAGGFHLKSAPNPAKRWGPPLRVPAAPLQALRNAAFMKTFFARTHSLNSVQRIIKNSGAMLFSMGASQLISVIVTAYISKVLGPEGFGKISMSFSIIVFFTFLTNLGLPLYGSREIARTPDRISGHINNIFTIRLILIVFAFIVLLPFSYFFDNAAETQKLLLLYGLLIVPSGLMMDWVFQGLERMSYIALARLVSAAVYMILSIVFLKSADQILLVPCFQVAGELVAALLLILIFSRERSIPRLDLNLDRCKDIISHSWPIGVSMILIQVVHYLDKVMLGLMRSTVEVGYYSASYKIIMMLLMIGAIYHDVMFPVFSASYKRSIDSLQKLYDITVKLMVTVSLPLAVGGTILAEPIITWIYGPEYLHSVFIFKLLIWNVALGYLTMIYSKGLIAIDKQRQRLRIDVVQASIIIVFNLILIPKYGMVGAASVTVLAHAVVLALGVREMEKVVQARYKVYIVKAAAASLPMAAFLYWGLNIIGMGLFALVLGGGGIYLISLFAVKGTDIEEIRMIRALMTGSGDQ